jgi:hypothetical protein
MVGVNVRTVGTFWRVVHYALTLPPTIDSIHLLPVWEPGVVGSLYGMASWEINREFLDPELAAAFPHLDTPERQLRATVNTLHLTGRAVGMDVIPHTDRFSQMVLAQPSHFEWLVRRGAKIADHRAELHQDVERFIAGWLGRHGPAHPVAVDAGPHALFHGALGEEDRCRLLFGAPEDPDARNRRRALLIHELPDAGFEPVPATMAPPFRGLSVDPGKRYVDAAGDVWLDYRITRPEPMSRVFGPLTRYKLFERVADNSNWEIDFSRPREAVWEYVCSHYDRIQSTYGFDFMRGDMSHVQMRPGGVPADIPPRYDLHRSVKERIGRRLPSFGYFAESFVAPPGVMLYGDEIDHLEASGADVTLGDLQSVAVSTDEFQQRLRQYLDIAATRSVTPCFTLMTGDKDDPRFDEFYLDGNELRAFCGCFLTALPSYAALGFELRDPRPQPVANEFYSKLYVFQESEGRNATHGPYRFGGNTALYERLMRIHAIAGELMGPVIPPGAPLTWLLPPDATAGRKVIAWALAPAPGNTRRARRRGRPDRTLLVFVANCNRDTVSGIKLPFNGRVPVAAEFLFSTVGEPGTGVDSPATTAEPTGDGVHLSAIAGGECLIYRVRMGRTSR